MSELERARNEWMDKAVIVLGREGEAWHVVEVSLVRSRALCREEVWVRVQAEHGGRLFLPVDPCVCLLEAQP